MDTTKMTRQRKVEVAAVLLLGTVVAGATIYHSKTARVTRYAEAKDGGDAATSRAPVRVKVINPSTDNITRMVRIPAEVMPYREVMIKAKIAGYVAVPPLEVGTRVDPKGVDGKQTLLKLNVPELDAEQATAESRIAKASAGITEAEQGVTTATQAVAQAQQMVAQAEATRAKVEGRIRQAQANVTEAQAELQMRGMIHSRLADIIAKSPNLVAQDKVDEAKGNLEIAKARVEAANVAVQGVRDELRVAEAAVRGAKSKVLAARADVEAARAAVKAVEAGKSLESAKQQETATVLKYATIEAPFKGVIAERMVELGELVLDASRNSGAKALYRVVADDKLRVRFYVAAPDAPVCKVGNAVEIYFEELKMEPIKTKITRIADALDPSTRTMEVEIEIDNPRGKDGARMLRAGMFAKVHVFLETYENALVVPARCVTTKKRKSSVLVVDSENKVRKIPVKIGVDDALRIQILDGIDASARVIIAGGNLVADGDAVEAVSANQ